MGPFNFNPNNPVFNRFGGYNNFMTQFNQFCNQFSGQGMNPAQYAQQQIQQKLNSGQITQEQFNMIAQQANMFMGK